MTTYIFNNPGLATEPSAKAGNRTYFNRQAFRQKYGEDAYYAMMALSNQNLIVTDEHRVRQLRSYRGAVTRGAYAPFITSRRNNLNF